MLARVAGVPPLLLAWRRSLAPVVRAANGAFPDEFSIHFPASAPHRIHVGANFGLLVTEDDGATWRYACEPWVSEGSSAALAQYNVDFYQLTADERDRPVLGGHPLRGRRLHLADVRRGNHRARW